MTRREVWSLTFAACALLICFTLIWLAAPARANTELSEDVQTVASETGVEPIDLQGAVNTTGLDAREYAYQVELLPRPHYATVRLTFYVESGLTYSGGYTYPGSTACSWNYPLGTTFRLPGGEQFTCNDRGHLGSSGWLDLFRRPDLVHKYGEYVVVEIVS